MTSSPASTASPASERLNELQKSYSDLAQSLHRPTTLKYMILWDLGSLCSWCSPKEGAETASCFPFNIFGSCLQQSKPKPCSSTMRKELGDLRRQVNQQRWTCWETEGSGMQVEVSMLSGRSWRFTIGEHAKGAEVKERLAELSGIPFAELGLVCGGQQVQDDEVLLKTRRTELAGHSPQLQLLRIFRPFALTCSTDCTLKVWDLDRDLCVQTLKGHGDGVTCLAVDWASRYAVSGSHDCTLRLWDLEHGICVQEIQVFDHPVFCVDFDHGAKRAITGSWDKQVKLWDTDDGVCLATSVGHEGMVKVVRLHWPSLRALSGSFDGTLRIWDLATGGCSKILTGHSDQVWAADVDWAASRALSGSRDQSLRLWDLDTGACLLTLRGHVAEVSCVSLDLASGRAFSGSWDRSARLWDLSAEACLFELSNGTAVTCLSVDWLSGNAAVGSQEALKLWDLTSGLCSGTLSGHLGREGYTSHGTNVSIGHMEAVSDLVINSPSGSNFNEMVEAILVER